MPATISDGNEREGFAQTIFTVTTPATLETGDTVIVTSLTATFIVIIPGIAVTDEITAGDIADTLTIAIPGATDTPERFTGGVIDDIFIVAIDGVANPPLVIVGSVS